MRPPLDSASQLRTRCGATPAALPVQIDGEASRLAEVRRPPPVDDRRTPTEVPCGGELRQLAGLSQTVFDCVDDAAALKLDPTPTLPPLFPRVMIDDAAAYDRRLVDESATVGPNSGSIDVV